MRTVLNLLLWNLSNLVYLGGGFQAYSHPSKQDLARPRSYKTYLDACWNGVSSELRSAARWGQRWAGSSWAGRRGEPWLYSAFVSLGVSLPMSAACLQNIHVSHGLLSLAKADKQNGPSWSRCWKGRVCFGKCWGSHMSLSLGYQLRIPDWPVIQSVCDVCGMPCTLGWLAGRTELCSSWLGYTCADVQLLGSLLQSNKAGCSWEAAVVLGACALT